MARKVSAGILLFRRRKGVLEIYLGHPGGPYFRGKDTGWWSIPKGRIEEGEEPEQAGRREFAEETGMSLPEGALIPLGEVKQRGGKIIHGWAVEWTAPEEPPRHVSNTYQLEWPPASGRMETFEEFDRAGFFPEPEARRKINEAQAGFIDRLKKILESKS